MYLKRGLSALIIFTGFIFLLVNSFILFRGAYKFGHDDLDKWAFGVAAAAVPYVIVVAGLIMGSTWRKTWFGLYRPTSSSLMVMFLWALFITYNLANGSGVVGLAREEKMAERTKASTDVSDARATRERLVEQLKSLPNHRPPIAVAALVEAEKIKKTYGASEGCKDPRTAMQRDTCRTIQSLEAEAATAVQAEQLEARIAQLDTQISSSGPVLAQVDPQIELLHSATGVERDTLRLWLPAMTPIVLEAGGAFCWSIGFGLLGWRIRDDEPEAEAAQPAPVFNSAPLPSPERVRAPVMSLDTLTAQRRLAEWFFRECVRPVAAGAMSEAEWYSIYSDVCRRSNDHPLPLESFRRIASQHIPRMHPIDGEWMYFERLPLLPQDA